MYLFIRRVIKKIVIIEAYQFCHICTNFIQRPAVKVNFIYRGNYWGSSTWISMQQVNLLTYSMVQSPSWAASQEIPRISQNPKVHYCTHKHPPSVSIMGPPDSVHIPTSHLLLIIYSAFVKYLRKYGNTMKQCISCL